MSDGKIGQEFYCSFDAEADEQLIPFDLVNDARAREITAGACPDLRLPGLHPVRGGGRAGAGSGSWPLRHDRILA
jgi:hypothetical protein